MSLLGSKVVDDFADPLVVVVVDLLVALDIVVDIDTVAVDQADSFADSVRDKVRDFERLMVDMEIVLLSTYLPVITSSLKSSSSSNGFLSEISFENKYICLQHILDTLN